MLRLFVVLALLGGGLQGSFLGAQHAISDSLLLEFRKTKDPRQQVDLLNQLSFSLFHHDLTQAYEYADQAVKIAKDNGYLKGNRLAETLRGYYFFEKGDFRHALEVLRSGARIPVESDEYLGYNYIVTGNVFRSIAGYDSAEIYYKKGISILERLDAKRMLAFAFRHRGRLYVLQWKNEEAENDFNKAEQIYSTNGSRFGSGEILFALGDLHKNLGNYQKAEAKINEGCAMADQLNDPYLKFDCKLHKAEILLKLGEFLESLEIFLEVMDQLSGKDEPRTLVRVFSGLGDVYEVLSQNDLALRYYMEALKISEGLDMKYETGKLYSNLAWIYKNQKNFSPAFEFLEKSLQVREEIKDNYGIANSYNVKGVIYFQQKRYKEAVEWINRALEIRKSINFIEGVAACYYNLGMIYEEKKEYPQALKYQLMAYEHEKNTGNKFNIGIAFSSIGSVYTYMGKFDSAQYYLQQAESIARQTGSVELQMEVSFYWSEYYEYQGKFSEALAWHKKFSALNDSIYHETALTKLAEMQALYQTDQKDKAITLLNQEKLLQSNELQLQKARIDLQGFVIVFVIVALILVSLLAYKTYRYNKEIKSAHLEIVERKEELQSQSDQLQKAYMMIAESNKQLEAKVEERTYALKEAYKELDTFFYRASHDFRRPLTTFLGLAEVAKITITDPNARELFNKVRETAVNLDKMLLKLQSISDLGSQQLSYDQVNINELFSRVLGHFKPQIEQKNIHTVAACDVQDHFFSYPEMIYIILENLVENSIAFCRYQEAHISLRAYEKESRIVLEVEDNGDGIDEKYHPRIFEMYFRGTDRSKGNGLGLYIIRKAAEKLNGTIQFRSQRDKGTTFILTFPLTLFPEDVMAIEELKKDALVI
jgi:signal transduction histidine kinase/tetratricopeptide (TPR) repeat protein